MMGSPTVFIGGVPAARHFDLTLPRAACVTVEATKIGTPAQTELPIRRHLLLRTYAARMCHSGDLSSWQ